MIQPDTRPPLALDARLRFRVMRPDARPRGFTIIELLIVTAIIIVLLSILIVAVNAATRSSQKARTAALMTTIEKGLIRFKEDMGYYPPLLGPDPNSTSAPTVDVQRTLAVPPNPDLNSLPQFESKIQKWYSNTAIAEYLVGYGHHYQDGYGRVPGAAPLFDWAPETPAAGIRHPGTDGVWGASIVGNGSLCYRMGGDGGCNVNSDWPGETNASDIDRGRVFGPYLELTDERLLGSITSVYDDNTVKLAFPGEPAYNPDAPHAVADYWGEAIRYYRRPYPPGAISQSYRSFDRDGDGILEAIEAVPTLSDFYFLRPFNIPPGKEVVARFDDAAGDTATTQDLEAAEFALFSLGPDRKVNKDMRIDNPDHAANTYKTDFVNQDNIVEVGP